MQIRAIALSAIAVACCLAATASAAEWGLKPGSPELKSAGPLTFGPDGILFVGDTKSATVFAIDTQDHAGEPAKVSIQVKGIKGKVADLLKVGSEEVTINDLAVNPISGNVYLSVSQGPAEKQSPALVRIDANGQLSQVATKDILYAKSVLPDAPEDKVVENGRRRQNRRDESITDLAYVDGKVIVSGLSNSDSPSTVRELVFPFLEAAPGVNVEIYHGAHGRYEDYAAVRTLVPFNLDGEPIVLAGFTCTPLVKFPVSRLTKGEKVRGTTVAELGNRNRPLDMIVYNKDGKRYLLMANSARGVMKISTENIERSEGISEPVKGGGTAGQTYETIASLEGVTQLDRLNDQNAVVIIEKDGVANLQTVALP
ncbi:MAG: hypothetical protein KDA47_17560 [Planctomycetales bacterium]|nr:hypothetical protein [Planctomycetales bacterium]